MQDKSGPSGQGFPGRAEHSVMRTKYTLEISLTLLFLDTQVPYTNSSSNNIIINDSRSTTSNDVE